MTHNDVDGVHFGIIGHLGMENAERHEMQLAYITILP